MGSTPGSGRSPEEGSGNPLQNSCLGKSRTEEIGKPQTKQSKESDMTVQLNNNIKNRHSNHRRSIYWIFTKHWALFWERTLYTLPYLILVSIPWGRWLALFCPREKMRLREVKELAHSYAVGAWTWTETAWLQSAFCTTTQAALCTIHYTGRRNRR